VRVCIVYILYQLYVLRISLVVSLPGPGIERMLLILESVEISPWKPKLLSQM